MSGFDFWRLPGPSATLSASEDEAGSPRETSAPTTATTATNATTAAAATAATAAAATAEAAKETAIKETAAADSSAAAATAPLAVVQKEEGSSSTTPTPTFDSALEALGSSLELLQSRFAEVQQARRAAAATSASAGFGGDQVGASSAPPALEWALDEAESISGVLALEKLDSLFSIDTKLLQEISCPVQLAPISSYLARLRSVPTCKEATLHKQVPIRAADALRCCFAAKLAQQCGMEAVPSELWCDARNSLASGTAASSAAPSRTVQPLGAAALEVPDEGPRPDWRWLLTGSPSPFDGALASGIKAVPKDLPNPLTVGSDIPALVATMLEDIPPEEWDAKRFCKPQPLPGFPSLYRGLGGLLPDHTPRELAQNMVAAAILNRLSGNVLIWAARAARIVQFGHQATAEEEALKEAEAARAARCRDLLQAEQEEEEAEKELSEFRRSYALDAKRQHYLESVQGWKSSAKVQAVKEVEAARKAVEVAAAALEASRGPHQAKTWRQEWPGPLPKDLISEEWEIFGVRLSSKAPVLTSINEFLEALENGLVDRSGGSAMITKHTLEAAFVRQAYDALLLCTCESEGEEAAKVYTHMPMPLTAGAGFTRPGDKEEFVGPRPMTSFHLKLVGQTFPFEVSFGPVLSSATGAGGTLAFRAGGALPETTSTRWNPAEHEAHDVLWDREAKECLDLIPTITVLAALVADPRHTLGILPPLQLPSEVNMHLGTAGVALIQAVLHNDVKAWPVVLPDDARVRWEVALRTLLHVLGQSRDLVEEDHTDAVRSALSSCLRALPRVPNDARAAGGSGSAGCGCSSGSSTGGAAFSDRLLRMRLSALSQLPLVGTSDFRAAVGETADLWQSFMQETSL